MDYDVFILTKAGFIRRADIIAELPIEAKIYDSSKSSNFQNNTSFISQKSNVLFLGREITENEKNCLIAHTSIIRDSHKEWSVVFEDDAIVDTDGFSNLLYNIESLKITRPTIILLYIGDHGVFLKKTTSILTGIRAHKCLALPSGAVSYVFNAAAAEIVRDCNEFVGTADWPTWSRYINFYGIFPQLVNHDFTLPSITQTDNYDLSSYYWPSERYRISKMFFGFFLSSQRKAYGSFFGYIQINVCPAFYRRISRYLKIFFIRT
jgi:GR25 family glycosyltransferase involved in LPS biosynthesis